MLIKEIAEQVDTFVLTSPKNFIERVETLSTVPTSFSKMQIWELPLFGVASAKDPLWDDLKKPDAVGPRHKSPCEWLPEAKSVISYFLPYTERIRAANRVKKITATEWLYGRWEGELFNEALRAFVVNLVEARGYQAVAPVLNTEYEVLNLRSNWSERHVAFIAGLGTFSLSRSLITKLGSAGRFGSVVVDFYLEPTKRPYEGIDDYCSKCQACARRCPPKAISRAGKDNEVCKIHLAKDKAKYNPRYGCAKCQTGVPCEGRIPGRSSAERPVGVELV